MEGGFAMGRINIFVTICESFELSQESDLNIPNTLWALLLNKFVGATSTLKIPWGKISLPKN
jgi:hypothetical protein